VQHYQRRTRDLEDQNLKLARDLAAALRPTAPSMAVVTHQDARGWTDVPVTPPDRWASWEQN
jgi:hypothetical protein